MISLVEIAASSTAAPQLAAQTMRSFVTPIVGTMCVLAGLLCTFFLIRGGYGYMTSAGSPEKLVEAKKLIRNALIGLAIVFGASALTAILSHAYGAAHTVSAANTMPILTNVKPQPAGSGLADVLIKAITGMLQTIIQAIAYPFMSALNYFTSTTPLMAPNSSVFSLWLAIVGIADALFILVVALLGFHVMSYATFGLEEIEFKHLLPQLGIVFLLLNTSIFAIDGIISISNAMIGALRAVFPATTVWQTLSDVAHLSGSLGIATLLIMIAFFIFAVILLIYYVGRLVTLYIGAVLSPLVVLLWLIPGFRDFVETAAKVYLSTIFVLFIHVVILQLAASIFAGLMVNGPNHTADPIMAMVVGLATVITLLKTQGVLTQFSYASIGPRSARKLGGQFVNSLSYISREQLTRTRDATLSANQLSFFQNQQGGPKLQPEPVRSQSIVYDDHRLSAADLKMKQAKAKDTEDS